ncbi:MAG: folate-binding protein YgfZ [Pararhodobacter sp.]|nr:folate-binding protein YgfZ [Pararhodobacter sp.]
MAENETRSAPALNRAIFRIDGPDRLSFLQGLVTNDMNRLAGQGILYAAFLTPQGKFLADFFLVDQGEAVLLDTDVALADDLLKRLTLYKLRSKVTIERVDMAVTRGLGPAPDGALADPRHPDMGWRLYGASLEQGDAIDWDAQRVAALVPETGAELISGESFILELGFGRLSGVDFRKGCYVGQEVTARMHHKTELRKGLVRVRVDGPAEPGTPITTDSGKPAGTLHTRAGERALAWLRHDRAEGALQAGEAQVQWDRG